DKDIREKAKQLAEVRSELEQIDNELAKLNSQIRHADVLLPVKQKLDQIASLRSTVGDVARVEQLPDGLRAELQGLDEVASGLKEQISKLDEDRAACEARLIEYTDGDKYVLEREQRIQSWLRRVAAHEKERRDLDELQNNLQDRQREIARSSEAILTEPWGDELTGRVSAIALSELKARIDRYEERRTEYIRRTNAQEAAKQPLTAAPLPMGAGMGVCAVGALLVAAGLVTSLAPLWVAGIALAAAGCAIIILNSIQRKQNELLIQKSKSEKAQLDDQQRRAKASLQKAQQDIADLLCAIPVASSILESPDLALYQAVRDLQTRVTEYHSQAEALQRRRDAWGADQHNLEELVGEFESILVAEEGISTLNQMLENAKGRRKASGDAKQEIEELDRRQADLANELRYREDKKERLQAAIAAATGMEGDLEEALNRAVDLQKLAARIRNAEEELENEHPGLGELREEIARLEQESADSWMLDREEVEECRLRAQNIIEQKGELEKEAVRLSTEIDSSRSGASVAELDGEILRLEEEIRDAKTQRDRLALLESILQHADRRFREDHQPDVLRRASGYLSRITEGRYQALAMVPDDQGNERLAVIPGEDGGHLWVEHPLSSGILDQIYLAFRLSVVDHLDQDHEHLPLFLDEVLVNWDESRFEQGVGLLHDIAAKRQVFIFTCHRHFAERVANMTGSDILELSTEPREEPPQTSLDTDEFIEPQVEPPEGPDGGGDATEEGIGNGSGESLIHEEGSVDAGNGALAIIPEEAEKASEGKDDKSTQEHEPYPDRKGGRQTVIHPGKRGGRSRGTHYECEVEQEGPEEDQRPFRFKPEVLCWKKEWTWQLGIEVPEEILDCGDPVIDQNGVPLRTSETWENRWLLGVPSSEVVVRWQENEEQRETIVDLGDDGCLVFRLSGRNVGRRVRTVSSGSYLVVAPEGWKAIHAYLGTPMLEPESVSASGYLAHFFDLSEVREEKIAFLKPGEHREHVVESSASRVELRGNEIDDGHASMGPLFGGEPPEVLPDDANGAEVKTIVVGEEGPGRGKWRKWFTPESGGVISLKDHMLERGSGWYFIRFYDENDRLLDSLDFRLSVALRCVRRESVSLLPASEGHSPLTVELCHTSGCRIRPANASARKAHVKPGNEATFIGLPSCPGDDETLWEIVDEHGSHVEIAISAERIWWALGTEESEPEEWADRTLKVGRNSLRATSDAALWLRLPQTGRVEHIAVGFESTEPRDFTPRGNERTVRMPLRNFSDSSELHRCGDHRLQLHISKAGRHHAADVLAVSVRYRCKPHGTIIESEDDLVEHVAASHINDHFRLIMKYNELRSRISSLPAGIHKCAHCDYYLRTDDKNYNTKFSHHLLEMHDDHQLHFRIVNDVAEIREAVIHNLPDVYICRSCGIHVENPSDPYDLAEHIVSKHKAEIFELE
ncbi:MAG: hypothetical protein HQ592_18130, partial [Planctomycetes bacterium]|nr:hypothetical protein [Planctomycetota bacterium]